MCFVEMGAYSSLDECVMWQSSSDDWAPCVAGALAKQPAAGGLDFLVCLVDELEANTACLSTKACDAQARAECELEPLKCLDNDETRTVALEISVQCPDITLLPRQH
jgi:hypothetical protein